MPSAAGERRKWKVLEREKGESDPELLFSKNAPNQRPATFFGGQPLGSSLLTGYNRIIGFLTRRTL